MVKSCYQGIFFWFTSKDWKNSAKSLCTTSTKKTGQANKTKLQTKQKDSISLTSFRQYLRFMQIILNCHTLSRSCSTKLWPPPGWQFFFHLGFQTAELHLLYFPTSPPPCPASALPSVMLLCVSRMRSCSPARCMMQECAIQKGCYWYSPSKVCALWAHKVGQILSVQSIQKSISLCSKHQWKWTDL